jgi:hypothetical protein
MKGGVALLCIAQCLLLLQLGEIGHSSSKFKSDILRLPDHVS